MRSDLECSSPAFDGQKCCKNTKDTNHVQLIMCRFCLCCVKCLQIVCQLSAGLEYSRSSLVFKCILILFSECSIKIAFLSGKGISGISILNSTYSSSNGKKSLYSGINVQSPSKSITTIPALPAFPLSEVEWTE